MKTATRAPIFLYFSVYLLSAADHIYALPSVGEIGGGLLNIAKRLLLSSSSGIDDPGPEFLVRRDDNSTNSTWNFSSGASAKDDTGVWILDTEYSGSSFFDDWTFYTGEDPTHGLVQYVDRDTAFSEGLAFVDSNNTVHMKGDNTSWVDIGSNRKSVRISSNKYWTHGLFVLDVNRIPWGCATWPAYWTLGATATWPAGGEVDIIEGVHDNIHNQVAWHTESGCSLTNDTANFTGTVVGQTDCDGNINNNAGCAITDWSRVSYGESFDAQGGGVYVMMWDDTGIYVWYYYRVSIPQDITDGDPRPSTWTTPSAALSPKGCDIDSFFFNHSVIFDITFCGDWAGNSYATTPNCPGTCEERLQYPANFTNATWSINYLKVYQKQDLHASVTGDALSSLPLPSATMIIASFTSLLAFWLSQTI